MDRVAPRSSGGGDCLECRVVGTVSFAASGTTRPCPYPALRSADIARGGVCHQAGTWPTSSSVSPQASLFTAPS